MIPGSERLLQQLGKFPRPSAYWVAFSGGLDSLVLLHLLAGIRDRLAAPLHAIHCDHGLQPGSADWAEHCLAQCQDWSIPCRIERLHLAPQRGESLEALARDARYRAFAGHIGECGMLLSAHHQDDQAETVLLQLLRGAGVAGLAAMPALTTLGEGWLARPLLPFGRADLEAYARAQRLDWLEDPSNRNEDFDRNYLRQRVMPLLRGRWPSAAASISHSAALCAEAHHLIRTVAVEDLERCRGDGPWRLHIPCLQSLPAPRQAAVLRAWVADCGLPPVPRHKLQQVFDTVIPARADAMPLLEWRGAQLRRYRAQLWLMPPLAAVPGQSTLGWSDDAPLSLPAGLGELAAHPAARGLDYQRWASGRRTVRLGASGLSCTPAGRRGSHPLRKLFQELGVPPWLRDRVPLLFIDDELAALGDYLVCNGFAAAAGAPAVDLTWQTPDWLR